MLLPFSGSTDDDVRHLDINAIELQPKEQYCKSVQPTAVESGLQNGASRVVALGGEAPRSATVSVYSYYFV